MNKPLDKDFFNQANFKELRGAIRYDNMTKDEAVLVDEFVKKAIIGWPKAPGGLKVLEEQLHSVASMTKMEAGEADAIYQRVIELAEHQSYDMESYKRRDIRTKAMEGYKEVDGKVVAVVDLVKFKNEMTLMMAKLNKEDIVRSVVKQSAEQDLFMMIKEMLTVEETYGLIGLLSARLLVGKEPRDAIDIALNGLTVLKNRAGKLSVGLVRLGGFVGLASVKGEPSLASAMKWIKNPILGEDVVDKSLVKKAGESETDFKMRKETHERQWVAYKEIMTQMKTYRVNYEAFDMNTKTKMRAAVLSWTVGI